MKIVSDRVLIALLAAATLLVWALAAPGLWDRIVNFQRMAL